MGDFPKPEAVANEKPRDKACEEKVFELQMKAEIRNQVEETLAKEIKRIEEQRKKVYAAYAFATVAILGILGVSGWTAIPNVVRSLISDPATGQLAQVFNDAKRDAASLKQEAKQAEQTVMDLNKKMKSLEGDLSSARDSTAKSDALVGKATKNLDNAQVLQAQLTGELNTTKEAVSKLQSNLVEIERGVIKVEFLQNAGRNQFPSPYQQRILQEMDSILLIAVPNPTERAAFVQELANYLKQPSGAKP